MDLKERLEQIMNNDITCNKSATKYLYKRNPEIWQEVLNLTQFLPPDAKAKRRIWHIMNDVWEIPKCPITNLEVKWWDNRYLGTANTSARTTLLNKQGKLQNQSEAVNEKRKQTQLRKIRDNEVVPYEDRTVDMKQYVPKILATKVEKGMITPIHLKTEREIYQYYVKEATKESWNRHFDTINPNRVPRGNDYHLDHIYSIHQGFIDGIPPYIIAHWTNLRMLTHSENESKQTRCDKSIDQLFEDFFNNSDLGLLLAKWFRL